MHKASFDEMRKLLDVYLTGEESLIIDVGSREYEEGKGSYRPLVPKGYVGLDTDPGENVDIVMSTPFDIPLSSGSVDVVLCGQVLEHCLNPFRLVKEISRVLKINGMLFLVAPFIQPPHYFPRDCFRFLPDGMKAIIEESGLKCLKAYIKDWVNDKGRGRSDCWGIGVKHG